MACCFRWWSWWSRRVERSRAVRVRTADFFPVDNLRALEERGIDGYVPDSHLARWLNRGGRLRTRANEPAYRRMRRKLRDPAGRAIYAKRKAIVEPVNGVLKEQRGMRRFRQRGLAQVRGEWALTSTAYNLTRLWHAHSPLTCGRPRLAAPHASLLFKHTVTGSTIALRSAYSSLGLAISVACGGRPARSPASAAALAPSVSLEHARRCLVPPTPAIISKKCQSALITARLLHASAPPSHRGSGGPLSFVSYVRTAPQSNDLHSPPAYRVAQRESATLAQKSAVRIGPRKVS